MNRAMTHRGPDDEGYFTDQTTQLAMRRLSIIDVAGGRQPITTDDGRHTVVFNGEIYNFQAVRDDLTRLGHRFHTLCDTEVVLHAFVEWGPDSLQRLRGMFALAIWDRDTKELFCARDRLGIKPFLFAETSQWFGFASEVKALLQMPGCPRTFDHEALHHHLALGALPTPMTLFKEIRALPPGHMAWYRNGNWRQERYWDVSFDVDPRITESDAVEGLEHHLQESVKLRLISDVPLGAFLSGGIDSSLVVGMMAKLGADPLKTFSIGWESKYAEFNETHHARSVAKRYGTDHHERTVTSDDLLGELPRIVWAYDQPTPSAFQTYFVSKFTKSQGITVALSGLGGDEIAAGYRFFPGAVTRERRWRRVSKLPGPLLRQLARMSHRGGLLGSVGRETGRTSKSAGWLFRNHRMLDGIEEMTRSLYASGLAERALDWSTPDLVMDQIDAAPSDDIVNRLIYHELHRFMVDDPLTDTDRCSMAHSLEVRVPLIDHELVEYAGTIPPHLKVRGGESKRLLKKLAETHLPHDAIYRRKMGFEIPLPHWVNGELTPVLDSVLSKEVVAARGLFRPEEVSKLRKRAASSDARGPAGFVWSLAVIELWCRLYLDSDTPTEPDIDLDTLINQTPAVSLAV